jgi:MtN3 and saliva related transmembrane protein
MNLITLLGFVAASCTTVAFLPQVIKTYKSKSTKDLSGVMATLLVTGISLWLVYGILIRDWPVIIANFFTLTMVMTLLYFKLRYKEK